MESYNLVNIRAGWRFWQEQAELAITAYNALNDRHREHPLPASLPVRVPTVVSLPPASFSLASRLRLAVRLRLVPSPPLRTLQRNRYSPCRAH